MLLCFVDESDQGAHYYFAGLMADEWAVKQLTDALNAIMLRAHTDYGIPSATEIHAHPMFHGKEAWSVVGQRARANLHERILDAILAADVVILVRSVDANRLRERQARQDYPVNFPPEVICFQHLLQRVDMVAKRRSTHALVIADERSDRERHRERFSLYQTEGTPGAYKQTKLDAILDTVHFAPSHRSRMLQAVDLLAFTYRRIMTVQETDPRAQKVMDRMHAKLRDSGKLVEPGSWPRCTSTPHKVGSTAMRAAALATAYNSIQPHIPWQFLASCPPRDRDRDQRHTTEPQLRCLRTQPQLALNLRQMWINQHISSIIGLQHSGLTTRPSRQTQKLGPIVIRTTP